ncbi:hypothetical protein [Pseudomonas sp. 58 R 12]|nr:hypothetical protein [Pseudomonas sp. 58 R 12]
MITTGGSATGTPYPLIKDEVRLDIKTPGRATFTIQADGPVKGLVTLDVGYNDNPLQRHFIGFVERSTAINSVQQILVCRELAVVLSQPMPLNLRHVDLQGVLAEVSDRTGLRFRVPDKAYAKVKAPFFYSLAAGYLAMDSLASVFSIPDFIWQQGNGEVFVGSWADSFFGIHSPLQLPVELFDGYQGNQSAMIAALPGLRPGATINQGERVTSLALPATKWRSNGRRNPSQRRAAIPRTDRRIPPATLWPCGGRARCAGRTWSVRRLPAALWRRRGSVAADGEPDPNLPILTGLPLPAPMGGQDAGMFGFPEEGTTVVVSFAYGLPHKPFITQILPHGLSLPRVPKGDQVWQHSEACQQRVDADGNWLRQTDGKIQDKAIEREVEAMQNTESFQSHTRTVEDHSTESVGGIKKIEALGALKLLSGGSASLAAVDDLHQANWAGFEPGGGAEA